MTDQRGEKGSSEAQTQWASPLSHTQTQRRLRDRQEGMGNCLTLMEKLWKSLQHWSGSPTPWGGGETQLLIPFQLGDTELDLHHLPSHPQSSPKETDSFSHSGILTCTHKHAYILIPLARGFSRLGFWGTEGRGPLRLCVHPPRGRGRRAVGSEAVLGRACEFT